MVIEVMDEDREKDGCPLDLSLDLRDLSTPDSHLSGHEEMTDDIDVMNEERRGGGRGTFKNEGEKNEHLNEIAHSFVNELNHNYGIYPSVLSRDRLKQNLDPALMNLTKAACRKSSSTPRTTLRHCLTQALLETSKIIGDRADGKGGRLVTGGTHMARLLSAKRKHINGLMNEIGYLEKRVKELEKDLREAVRLSRRHESTLKKFQDMETEMPYLLESHRMEIRLLQEKLRKIQSTSRKDNAYIKNSNSRLQKLTEQLAELKDLAVTRNLPERDTLDKKIKKKDKEIMDKTDEIKDLNRRLSVSEKGHRLEIAKESERGKVTKRKLRFLQKEHEQLQDAIKERDRELAALAPYRFRGSQSLTSALSTLSLSAVSIGTTILPSTNPPTESASRRYKRKSTARRRSTLVHYDRKTSDETSPGLISTSGEDNNRKTSDEVSISFSSDVEVLNIRSKRDKSKTSSKSGSDSGVGGSRKNSNGDKNPFVGKQNDGWTTESNIKELYNGKDSYSTPQKRREPSALPSLSGGGRLGRKKLSSTITLSSSSTESRASVSSQDRTPSPAKMMMHDSADSNLSDKRKSTYSVSSQGDPSIYSHPQHLTYSSEESVNNIYPQNKNSDNDSEEEAFLCATNGGPTDDYYYLCNYSYLGDSFPSAGNLENFSLIENYPPKERKRLASASDKTADKPNSAGPGKSPCGSQDEADLEGPRKKSMEKIFDKNYIDDSVDNVALKSKENSLHRRNSSLKSISSLSPGVGDEESD